MLLQGFKKGGLKKRSSTSSSGGSPLPKKPMNPMEEMMAKRKAMKAKSAAGGVPKPAPRKNNSTPPAPRKMTPPAPRKVSSNPPPPPHRGSGPPPAPKGNTYSNSSLRHTPPIDPAWPVEVRSRHTSRVISHENTISPPFICSLINYFTLISLCVSMYVIVCECM